MGSAAERYSQLVAELTDERALRYALEHTSPFAGLLERAAAWTAANTAAPRMMSGLAEARLLEVLVVVSGARRVLEIGTFTAVGTLAMAAALAPDARLITLERDPAHVAAARRHIAASPWREQIELLEGDALQLLESLPGPFDVVYIDAWKADYPAYYRKVKPKLSPRGVIVADNLFRDGAALEPTSDDEHTAGIREFARLVHADEEMHNVLLTIGDGVMLVWRRPDRV